MKENTKVTYNGISFCGLLTIVFITLKLLNVINWPWWLVLLPLYGGILFAVSLFIIICVIYFLYYRFLKK